MSCLILIEGGWEPLPRHQALPDFDQMFADIDRAYRALHGGLGVMTRPGHAGVIRVTSSATRTYS